MRRYSTESFQRGPEFGRASCRLRAQTYNMMRVLLARAGDNLFVPIRSMQYLAVADAEEVIFVDSQNRRWIAISWREFHPSARNALDDPVPYLAVHYAPDGAEVSKRIAVEFPKALAELAERAPRSAVAGEVRILGRKAQIPNPNNK